MNCTSSQTCDQVYRYRVSAQWTENHAASAWPPRTTRHVGDLLVKMSRPASDGSWLTRALQHEQRQQALEQQVQQQQPAQQMQPSPQPQPMHPSLAIPGSASSTAAYGWLGFSSPTFPAPSKAAPVRVPKPAPEPSRSAGGDATPTPAPPPPKDWYYGPVTELESGSLAAGGYRRGDRVTAGVACGKVAVGDAGTVIGPCNSQADDKATRVCVEFDGGKGQINCLASTQINLTTLAGGYRRGDRVTARIAHNKVAVGDAGTVVGPCTFECADKATRVCV